MGTKKLKTEQNKQNTNKQAKTKKPCLTRKYGNKSN